MKLLQISAVISSLSAVFAKPYETYNEDCQKHISEHPDFWTKPEISNYIDNWSGGIINDQEKRFEGQESDLNFDNLMKDWSSLHGVCVDTQEMEDGLSNMTEAVEEFGEILVMRNKVVTHQEFKTDLVAEVLSTETINEECKTHLQTAPNFWSSDNVLTWIDELNQKDVTIDEKLLTIESFSEIHKACRDTILMEEGLANLVKTKSKFLKAEENTQSGLNFFTPSQACRDHMNLFAEEHGIESYGDENTPLPADRETKFWTLEMVSGFVDKFFKQMIDQHRKNGDTAFVGDPETYFTFENFGTIFSNKHKVCRDTIFLEQGLQHLSKLEDTIVKYGYGFSQAVAAKIDVQNDRDTDKPKSIDENLSEKFFDNSENTQEEPAETVVLPKEKAKAHGNDVKPKDDTDDINSAGIGGNNSSSRLAMGQFASIIMTVLGWALLV